MAPRNSKIARHSRREPRPTPSISARSLSEGISSPTRIWPSSMALTSACMISSGTRGAMFCCIFSICMAVIPYPFRFCHNGATFFLFAYSTRNFYINQWYDQILFQFFYKTHFFQLCDVPRDDIFTRALASIFFFWRRTPALVRTKREVYSYGSDAHFHSSRRICRFCKSRYDTAVQKGNLCNLHNSYGRILCVMTSF